MLRRKKPAGEAAQPLLTAARDFETSLIDQMRRSERRAWRVATGAGLMSLLLAGGYGLVMPLKEQVPYLVLADPYRGTSSVARLEAGDTPLSASEAINQAKVDVAEQERNPGLAFPLLGLAVVTLLGGLWLSMGLRRGVER